MRGVAALIFYMLGLGAVVSFGIAGLMALQSPTVPTPPHQSLPPHRIKSELQSQSRKSRKRMRSPIRSARR